MLLPTWCTFQHDLIFTWLHTLDVNALYSVGIYSSRVHVHRPYNRKNIKEVKVTILV